MTALRRIHFRESGFFYLLTFHLPQKQQDSCNQYDDGITEDPPKMRQCIGEVSEEYSAFHLNGVDKRKRICNVAEHPADKIQIKPDP